MQIDDTEGQFVVRPVFAALVFGFVAALLFLVAALVIATSPRAPGLSWLASVASILAPCVPLIYFAARGFRRGRRSAFEEVPERACAAAASLFIALAVLLSLAAVSWTIAIGPGVAAVLFTACLRSVRERAFNSMTKPSGYFELTKIGGIPVFVHWSFPVGGVLVASAGHVDPRQWIYFSLAFTALIAIHEAGHVVAARLLDLRVLSIEISGMGGLCRVERPRHVRDGFLVYSGGLIAQLVLFVATLASLRAFDLPSGGLERALVVTFTYVNGALFVFNLIPHRGTRVLGTDGYVLWRLFLHITRGHPHPFPPLVATPPEEAPVFPSETRLLSKTGFRPRGFVRGLEILNDRTTPMEFVVDVLSRHLAISRDMAIVKMLEIHNNGGSLMPFASSQDGQRAAEAISAEARAAGHAFVCRYVDTK